MVHYPFQKLCYIQSASRNTPLLLAASGPYITTFNLIDGSVIHTYPRSIEDESDDAEGENGYQERENGGRPSKRRKLDIEANGSLSRQESEDSIEIVAERQKGQRRKPKVEISKLPNVSHLLATTDCQYVVVVTAEDKAVSVFSLSLNGRLRLESRRMMPKRLCAIVLSPDEQTILAGDKFGDVYSLPLLPSKDFIPKAPTLAASEKPFKPSATELTVHTKGNLQALRQQLEQKRSNSKKDAPAFEYTLLLGHVSLLTDVAIVELQHDRKQRQYIITADRDEHIRVSRGLSQPHIIENYCLGHREFVSKICVLPWQPEILLSGGGEPSLIVWNWSSGQLLDQELFNGAVEEDLLQATSIDSSLRALDKLAVQGIWTFQSDTTDDSDSTRLVLVAMEGLPVLLSYTIDDSGKLKHHQTLSLSGNVLDIATDTNRGIMIASIDTVHQPGSMNNVRPEEVPASAMFETFELSLGTVRNDQENTSDNREIFARSMIRWESSSLAIALNASAVSEGVRSEISDLITSDRGRSKGNYDSLGEFLYGLENLRKKRNWTGEDVEGQEAIEEDLVEHEE